MKTIDTHSGVLSYFIRHIENNGVIFSIEKILLQGAEHVYTTFYHYLFNFTYYSLPVECKIN